MAFARTGDPNGAGRPVWPRYTLPDDSLLEFTSTGPAARKEMDKARFDFIAASYAPKRAPAPASGR